MKRRCTGGKGQEDPMAPKAPVPWAGQGGSFSRLKSPKLPSFCQPLSFLHPSSIRAEQRSGVWESGLYLHLVPQLTQLPPVLCFPPWMGGGGGACARTGSRSAARPYLAKSQATPEQLQGPAGYLALIAQPGPNQGTRSRQCPRVGVGVKAGN